MSRVINVIIAVIMLKYILSLKLSLLAESGGSIAYIAAFVLNTIISSTKKPIKTELSLLIEMTT